MGEGRGAWAARGVLRCVEARRVARASERSALAVTACVLRARGRVTRGGGPRTGEIEYRRDLHPDAVGHLAIVVGDVPLVP